MDIEKRKQIMQLFMLLLAPWIMWQGRQVRKNTLRLPEANGPRAGLAERFQVNWQLWAKSSLTCAGILTLAQQQTQKSSFDVVVISAGVNDVTRRTPRTKWRNDLQAHCQQTGCDYLTFDFPFQPEYMAQDGFHPSAQATRLWANAVLSLIFDD